MSCPAFVWHQLQGHWRAVSGDTCHVTRVWSAVTRAGNKISWKFHNIIFPEGPKKYTWNWDACLQIQLMISSIVSRSYCPSRVLLWILIRRENSRNFVVISSSQCAVLLQMGGSRKIFCRSVNWGWSCCACADRCSVLQSRETISDNYPHNARVTAHVSRVYMHTRGVQEKTKVWILLSATNIWCKSPKYSW